LSGVVRETSLSLAGADLSTPVAGDRTRTCGATGRDGDAAAAGAVSGTGMEEINKIDDVIVAGDVGFEGEAEEEGGTLAMEEVEKAVVFVGAPAGSCELVLAIALAFGARSMGFSVLRFFGAGAVTSVLCASVESRIETCTSTCGFERRATQNARKSSSVAMG